MRVPQPVRAHVAGVAAVTLLVAVSAAAGSAERRIAPVQVRQAGAETPSVDEKRHAFLWRNGKLADLGTFGGRESTALALNERGQVVGWADSKGARHAFLWQGGKMRDLGTLPAARSRVSQGYAINDRGQVAGDTAGRVGFAPPSGHAFVWQSGRMSDLGTLGGAWSEVADINEAGQVVGNSAFRGELARAYLWERGRMTDLGAFDGRQSYAWAVNERGQVVGSSEYDEEGNFHAVLWEDGTLRDLGTLGGPYSSARAVNERGQIVGSAEYSSDSDSHAFLWQEGTMRDLGTLGGSSSNAVAVNERGQVVGNSDNRKGAEHAFLWQDGGMRDLGTLGGSWSRAVGINERGQVIGTSETRTGGRHAFLWQNGRMIDLGTLGGKTSEPQAINDRGEIAGVSTVPGDEPPALTSSTIVYVGAADNPESSDGQGSAIYTIRTDRSHGFRLSPAMESADSPAWSPDGRQLAYSDGYGIRLARANGSGSRRLSGDSGGCGPDENGYVGDLTWSPDGRRIAFTCEWSVYSEGDDGRPSIEGSYGDLFTIDVRTKGVRRLTKTPGTYEYDPSWAPDGRRIAFGNGGIFVLDLRTGRAHRLSTGFAPDWSADGKSIVYATTNTIAVMNPDGSGRRTILRSNNDVGLPSWSPDRSRVVYNERTRTGVVCLYIIRADGSGRRLLVRGGFDADWWPGRPGQRLSISSTR
jgi:probable HAF family extracellular repeat protein